MKKLSKFNILDCFLILIFNRPPGPPRTVHCFVFFKKLLGHLVHLGQQGYFGPGWPRRKNYLVQDNYLLLLQKFSTGLVDQQNVVFEKFLKTMPAEPKKPYIFPLYIFLYSNIYLGQLGQLASISNYYKKYGLLKKLI